MRPDLLIPILTTFFIHSSFQLKYTEIKHNILPFYVGKTYVSQSKHILMYHYNLTNFKEIMQVHSVLIDQINAVSSTIMLKNYVENVKHQIQQNYIVLDNLAYTRSKRGLVNIGGHIAKVLFGTLDSEDESLYSNYFQAIQKDMQTLKTSQNRVINIIRTMTVKYANVTNQMIRNYKQYRLVQNDINRMILIQFEQLMINRILNEINTAVTFARLHVLHESILPLKTFQKFVESTNFMNHLKHLKDFFSICYTSVKFHNDNVIFIIEIPITSPNPFDTYHLHYIPYKNVTLIEKSPYLLTEKEDARWSIPQECPKVEDWWICPQNALRPVPVCMEKLISHKYEDCPRRITQTSDDLLMLSSGKFLSVNNVNISEMCSEHTEYYKLKGIYYIETPCNITNSFKYFYNEKISTIFYHVVLPNMDKGIIDNLTIPNLMIDNVTTNELIFNWKIHPNHISSIYFVVTIILIISVIITLYRIFIIRFSRIVEKYKNNSATNAELISLKGGGITQ